MDLYHRSNIRLHCVVLSGAEEQIYFFTLNTFLNVIIYDITKHLHYRAVKIIMV
jgi:hypothetical protein